MTGTALHSLARHLVTGPHHCGEEGRAGVRGSTAHPVSNRPWRRRDLRGRSHGPPMTAHVPHHSAAPSVSPPYRHVNQGLTTHTQHEGTAVWTEAQRSTRRHLCSHALSSHFSGAGCGGLCGGAPYSIERIQNDYAEVLAVTPIETRDPADAAHDCREVRTGPDAWVAPPPSTGVRWDTPPSSEPTSTTHPLLDCTGAGPRPGAFRCPADPSRERPPHDARTMSQSPATSPKSCGCTHSTVVPASRGTRPSAARQPSARPHATTPADNLHDLGTHCRAMLTLLQKPGPLLDDDQQGLATR